MQKAILWAFLLCLPFAARGQAVYEYCYWFDNRSEECQYGTSDTGRWSLQLDVSDLGATLHQLHIQVKDTTGTWSAPRSSSFIKLAEAQVTNLRARYWFDNGKVVETEVTNGIQTLDVSALSTGIHFFHYQVAGGDGLFSSTRTAVFAKMEEQKSANLRARYWFDNGKVVETEVTNGIQTLDVSALSTGIHFFHYQVVGDDGLFSSTRTAVFAKYGDSANIDRYEYWINDDVKNCRIVSAQPMEPYRLIKLLDVESYPIRPSAFHFEVVEEVPYIYAKNDFHARFYSTNGLYAEDSVTYIDELSKREVTNGILLQSGIRRTDATPASDSIRWYRLEAYAGNSLTFCVSQPCSVELFSPAGESLLSLAGEAVLDSFTCHAPVDGIYYVALHSVTGADAETSIDYLRDNVKRYEVRYIVDGEVYAVDSVSRGERITVPEFPTKEGYTFTGWEEVPELMPDSNVVIMGAFILNAEQTDAQGLAYLLNGEKDAFSVSGYTHELKADIAIPDTLYGLPVKALLNGALKNAGVLETIVLPDGIASVGESAFSGCRNLLVVEWNADAALHASCFDAAEEYGNMLVFVQGANSSVNFGGNVVVDGVAEKITLTDGMPFRNPKRFTAKYISYSREFAKKTKVGVSGGWEGIVLPFAVQTIISEKKGILSPFGAGTEGLPCWVAEWLAGSRSFMLAPSNLANKPFIMEVPNSEDYEEKFNIDGVVTFMAENVTVEATAGNHPSGGNGFTLQGSYEGVTADGYTYALNDEVYITDEGTTYLPGGVFVADSRDVRPFEAYVYNNLLTRIRYLPIEQGINANSIPVEMLKDDRLVDVYTLQGVMVKRQIPVENLEKELPVGIYIVNGMKMVVK